MIITLDLPNLGPNTIKICSEAEDVHEVLDDLFTMLNLLFPECCCERAVLALAEDILNEEEN